ncbi:MAG: Eco57I restriction-modification methylase domain-containing protein [Cyanobacteria bacterium J06558_2]
MCTQVLSRYLSDETGMDEEKIKKIINFDPDRSLPEFKELMTPKQAKQLKLALQNLRCLDPAVGSAAFPMGMMQVILNVYQSIARREGNPIQRGSLAMSRLKRNIIANNLYGVDIKPEAIEIAKLRMWLSLVVDIPDIDDVEALPNLEYKLMRGDSVISTINGEVLIPEPTKDRDAIQLQLKVTPIQQAILPLLELQQQYFDAQTEKRSQLKKEILEAETNIFRVAISERRSVLESEDQKLDRTINKKGKLTKSNQKKKAAIADQISELDKVLVEVEEGKRSLSFFQYYLHFRDVFEVKGGFDIVAGNPPYIRQEQIKELKPALKQEFECYTGKSDLYVYFFEKGYRLLRSGGALTYITSNKYFRSGYGEKLRQYLGEQATVEHLIDFGDTSVFEAIAYPSIIQVSKAKPENHQTRILKWDKTKPLSEFVNVFKTQSFHLDQKYLTSDGWRLETPEVLRLLDKLRNAGTPLGEYVNGRFYRGIVTGCNEAFIIDQATRNRLIAEHQSSQEVLKPFVRGKDVKRWNEESPDLWLLFIPWNFPLHNDASIKGASKKAEKEFERLYPAIYNHLLQFRTKLSARNKAETGIRYEWYALQRCAATYWKEFETPKIIYPDIAARCEFAFDTNNLYPDCTTFELSKPFK